uniref:Medium-chain acyl-CoA ligase ACSF2, mitochondrial n=2 Tax=Cacopsylla melanoneura TaxID=428564 RepID=A0A8D8QYQ4_9HEMI
MFWDSCADRNISDGTRISNKPSYWNEKSTEPLKTVTIGELLDHAALRYGDKEALVSCHQNQRLSFRQIQTLADEFAAGLLSIGLKPRDKLVVWGTNSTQWYLTLFACAKVGIVLVNMNPALQSPEVLYLLRKVDANAILMTEEMFKTQDFYKLIKAVIPELESTPANCTVSAHNVPSLTHVIINSEQQLRGTFRLKDVMQGAPTEYLKKRDQISKTLNCMDGINIQFTSGTTGHPKAAFLTHYNLINNSNFIGKRLEFDKKEHKILLQVPMFHTFGTAMGILNAMNHGNTVVVPASSFKSIDSLKAIANEKCTVLYGTPTMYVDLLNSVQPLCEEFPNMRDQLRSPVIALSAGAPCSPTLFNKIKDTFGVKHLISAFGMTEISPVAFLSLLTDTDDQMLNYIGYPLPHQEVKVVDKRGNIVPMGMCGEVCYRGYNVMLGYYGEENNILKNDGWFSSGDYFILHESGYGQVVGRIKDIIIRGGENIIPKEIEDFLQTHPDIMEIQVYGVPDERLGEIVAASILLTSESKLKQEDVKAYCKGKIAHFKIPQHIKFVASFPKTETGKIQKYRLREMAIQEFQSKATNIFN